MAIITNEYCDYSPVLTSQSETKPLPTWHQHILSILFMKFGPTYLTYLTYLTYDLHDLHDTCAVPVTHDPLFPRSKSCSFATDLAPSRRRATLTMAMQPSPLPIKAMVNA